MNQETRWPLEAGEDKGADSLLEPPKGMQPWEASVGPLTYRTAMSVSVVLGREMCSGVS